jgi:mannitol operon repressor
MDDEPKRDDGKPPGLLETHPHLADFMSFLEDFNRETERGAALAAAAMIDDLLQRILVAFLIENEGAKALMRGVNAPLGTFAAKTAAAHSLGLITDTEHADCMLIRKIRNEFAHKVRMSFKDDEIKKLCARLAFSAKDYGHVVVDTRGKFTTAAVAVILNLTNRPHYVREKKLTPRSWPY